MDQLESLLNDLQNTTHELKRNHSTQQHQLSSSSSPDKEPIYEAQNTGRNSSDFPDSKPMASPATANYVDHGLQDLEQLLDDYSSHRGRANGRPTVESLLGELDNVVPNGESKKQPSSVSTASKDLDNLMTSLAQFKVREVNTVSRRTYTERGGQPPPSTGNLQSYADARCESGQQPPYTVNVQSSDAAYSNPVKKTTVAPVYSSTAIAALPSTLQQKPSSDTAQLDSILGSLSDDLSKHGIATIPKGDCAACQKTIVGQVVIALGRMWHPEHFTCAHCHEELGHKNFFERSGCAYCENDYHNLFSPRCAYCNGPIKDKCVTALEKTWHPEHFFCATCGKEFGDDGFHEREGRAYCRQDFFSAFAPRCRGCKRAITDNYVTALNHQWHPDCFVCQGYDAAIQDWHETGTMEAY